MITFHTIHNKVAIAVDAAVGVSGLAYLALSILPCVDVRCPYRTPISQLLWYPCRAFFCFAAPFLNRCTLGLCELPNQPAQSSGLSGLRHWEYLKYGLEKSIFHRAVITLRDEDRGRVTWLFNHLALGDRHKFLRFAASIPRHKIPDLIPSIESVSFRESLLVLLRSVAGTRPGISAWLDSDVHRRSLLVCLHAIRHVAKVEPPTIPDLDFMRDQLADTNLMRALWGGVDNSIRITSRSICALVARQVVKKQQLKGEDLRWLQEVTGCPSDAILEADDTVRDQMNFKSFVYGALSNNLTETTLSTEDARSFNETLAISLGIRTIGRDYFATPEWQIRLSEEVGRIQQYDPRGGRELFNRLHSIFPSLPAVPSAHAVPRPHEIPPSRAASPHRAVPPSRAVRPPRAVPPRTITPPGGHVIPIYHPIPSPAVAFLSGPIPSPRATPAPHPISTPHAPHPLVVAHPPRATRPSRGARSPHAPM